ncbi:GNAT family N-acetyltransferase [Hydrogenoanaerobacterium sp.]|uniref:GNAT family N-acetyltransferase n=1 Tax=Hydrogenoanaerobacterium sp. TaxID=2953763 RepID=UPI00289F2749|nr:GNAT family N-acetyltransferase [Hydrogenoanaerobacterium sp.]
MITFAKPEMLPELKAIWKECFGDADDTIDFYYNKRFRCENTLVWLEQGVPAAMLTLLPAELKQGEAYVPVQYVYAVATRKAHQGRGISSKLLEYANGLIAERGEVLSLLVPAQGELFSFYEKRGYTTTFSIKTAELTVEIPARSNVDFVFTNIAAHEYKQLRDAAFDREGYLRWDETAIAYALDENQFNGGFACKIMSQYGQAAALCYKIKDMLFVRETTLSADAMPAALEALALQHGCVHITVRLPAYSTCSGELRPFGMTSKPLQTCAGYLNLVLD